ncbi:hypothetical protein [Curtobacterium sp. MCBD17_040]|uniref:hypothetical protein n=1 Tax=Curtobacterium sp. MCBD17_040 TaxID=2175674 RepID=UPI000DA8EB0E|nr:hypothetical protein [Curtobacterium sp. MCBD17_040]WIB63330.1 hypothetical protein DEI94_14455 [Curtobacterium sp. MCBD17_040]
MSTYPPENDIPNDTPIYDRAVPTGSLADDDLIDDELVVDDTTDTTYSGVHVPSYGTDSASDSGGSGKADAAKGAAQNVAGDAKQSAAQVAGVAKEQASRVASEATDHAKELLGQATSSLKDQAGQQQQRAAGGLRTISDQLSSMAENADDGIAGKVVRDLSNRAGSVAGYLEGRDPGSLIDEVRSFAARRPGTFIAIAAGAGILAGRLTKALTTEIKHEKEAEAFGGATGGDSSSYDATSTSTYSTVTDTDYGTTGAAYGTTDPVETEYDPGTGAGYGAGGVA